MTLALRRTERLTGRGRKRPWLTALWRRRHRRAIVERYPDRVVLAPYPTLDRCIALTAWTRIDKMDELDERRVVRFIEAYRGIDHHLNRRPPPQGQSLVHSTACWLAKNPCAGDVEASSQIAFWLFVMKDAIELHTVRTLALIASAPEDVRRRLACELKKCTPLLAATASTRCSENVAVASGHSKRA